MKRIKIRWPDEDLENQLAERAQQSVGYFSERRRTEEALRQSRERFRCPVQYASDVTLLAKHKLKIK